MPTQLIDLDENYDVSSIFFDIIKNYLGEKNLI